MQLSASKSDAEARRKWVALVSRNPGLFKGLGRVIAKSYLGKRKGTWYRLRAGPFANRGAANQMCARAKKRKVACYVVRR